MRRRSVLASIATLGSLSGCLDVRSTGGEETADDSLYETGTIDVVVDGETTALTAERFQAEHADEDIRFHLHEGDEKWHMERERVTAAKAIDLLPKFAYERKAGADVLTIEEATYDERNDGTDIEFRIDADTVDPTAYELQDGDYLRVEVTTGR